VYTRPEVEAPHWKNKSVYDHQQDCDAVKKGHLIASTAYKKLSEDRKLQKILL
jgi:hypothetical protein